MDADTLELVRLHKGHVVQGIHGKKGPLGAGVDVLVAEGRLHGARLENLGHVVVVVPVHVLLLVDEIGAGDFRVDVEDAAAGHGVVLRHAGGWG